MKIEVVVMYIYVISSAIGMLGYFLLFFGTERWPFSMALVGIGIIVAISGIARAIERAAGNQKN